MPEEMGDGCRETVELGRWNEGVEEEVDVEVMEAVAGDCGGHDSWCWHVILPPLCPPGSTARDILIGIWIQLNTNPDE